MNIKKAIDAINKETIKLRITITGGAQHEENCVEYKFYPEIKCLKMKKAFPRSEWKTLRGMIVSVEDVTKKPSRSSRPGRLEGKRP